MAAREAWSKSTERCQRLDGLLVDGNVVGFSLEPDLHSPRPGVTQLPRTLWASESFIC